MSGSSLGLESQNNIEQHSAGLLIRLFIKLLCVFLFVVVSREWTEIALDSS